MNKEHNFQSLVLERKSLDHKLIRWTDLPFWWISSSKWKWI